MKTLIFFWSLLLICGNSFAVPDAPFYGKISTNVRGSPEESFLGKTLKLASYYGGIEQKNIIELNISTDKKYVMKRDDVEITVLKDKNNLNRIRLFSKYDLFLKGKNDTVGGYFYALCPVVEETKKDLSKVTEVKEVDGRQITTVTPKFEALSKRIIDPGFFTVAHKSNERHPILTKQYSKTFVEADVENLCYIAEIIIARKKLDEMNKKAYLERIENPK
ncbi:hypothetical protein [Acinetobacter sp. Ver3]|uniref:hypothetical protein n=1 Tax=Acinetobacter sp. Ver3 TaxID=466088 RepID=UPI00044C8A4A|nr:hypothetical protein [Acinetobacter sp. Ver3]EZQ01170.1 hypothetical protein CL42_15110 [Acinetobacter sp. Ver3]